MAKRKENILDLGRFLEKSITVKFAGGREVTGTLKGFDGLTNLVLDNCEEVVRDPKDPYAASAEERTRSLGLVVCRGTALMLISPADGSEQIPNPFVAPHEEEEDS